MSRLYMYSSRCVHDLYTLLWKIWRKIFEYIPDCLLYWHTSTFIFLKISGKNLTQKSINQCITRVNRKPVLCCLVPISVCMWKKYHENFSAFLSYFTCTQPEAPLKRTFYYFLISVVFLLSRFILYSFYEFMNLEVGFGLRGTKSENWSTT